MLNLLTRHVGLLRAGIMCARAQSLAHHKRYHEALDLIEKAEKETNYLPTIQEIQKAFLLYALERYDQSIKVIKLVRRRIDDDNKIDKQTKIYLNKYCDFLISLANNKGKAVEFPPSFYEDVQIRAVSAFVRRKFPLRTHPDWDRAIE